MTPRQVLQYYGSQANASRQLGIKQPSIHEWISKGRVPLLRQYQVQVLTDGMLTADNVAGKQEKVCTEAHTTKVGAGGTA